MNQTKKSRFWPALLTAGTFAAIWGAAGCGSGSHATPSTNAPISSTNFITRADEPTLSDEAKILATREATGAFVSLDAARAFDADLKRIKAVYYDVPYLSGRLDYEPKTLLVVVKQTAPWVSKWELSAFPHYPDVETDLTTGEPALDVLLKKYDAARTANPKDVNGERSYLLRFARSLNMKPVAEEFARVSPNVLSADFTQPVDNSSNVFFTASPNGERVYTFSQSYLYFDGFGGGHRSQYALIYTIAPDGGVTKSTSGTLPPPTFSIGGAAGAAQ